MRGLCLCSILMLAMGCAHRRCMLVLTSQRQTCGMACHPYSWEFESVLCWVRGESRIVE